MKIFATHVNGTTGPGFLPVFRQLAAQDCKRIHHLVDDPASADMILFLDVNEHQGKLKLSAITKHPLTREFPEKTFVYNELDQPWCAMPGLYVSMPRRSFNRRRQRSFGYITPLLNPFVEQLASQNEGLAATPDLLFSFIGRRCHAARDRVLELKHPRAVVEDSSRLDIFRAGGVGTEEKQRRYAQILLRSKFVLCPRGAGTASFRMFETMAVGRVPVILSDHWVPPDGPDWTRFSIRIREADADRVPVILEQCEPQFDEMGTEARRQWEEWFSPSIMFHRMVDACGELLSIRRLPEPVVRFLPDARYLRLRALALKTQVVRMLRR